MSEAARRGGVLDPSIQRHRRVLLHGVVGTREPQGVVQEQLQDITEWGARVGGSKFGYWRRSKV